jgi:hypothetical protein
MRATLWTTASVAKDYADVDVTITPIGNPSIALRRRNPNGTWCRMRIEMTPGEARALAFSIFPAAEIREVKKKSAKGR